MEYPKQLVITNLREYFSQVHTQQYKHLAALEEQILKRESFFNLEKIPLQKGCIIFKLNGFQNTGDTLPVWFYKFDSIDYAE